MKMNETARHALLAMAEDLEDGSYVATDRLYRHTEPFSLFCQYSEWCLADPQHGVLQHVTKCDQLRTEIEALVKLCKEQCTDVVSWSALMKPIMQIAMGDTGGKEARAADVAYGIAKAIADSDERIAGAAIRKLMRLTEKKTLYDKLAEMASPPAEPFRSQLELPHWNREYQSEPGAHNEAFADFLSFVSPHLKPPKLNVKQLKPRPWQRNRRRNGKR